MNAEQSKTKVQEPSADLPLSSGSSPDKENTLPHTHASSLQTLPKSSRSLHHNQQQQQPKQLASPVLQAAVNRRDRLSQTQAAPCTSAAHLDMPGTPTAHQRAFWVGTSQPGGSDASGATTQGVSPLAGGVSPIARVVSPPAGGIGQEEASRDSEAADAVTSQLEGLQLTPLQQLLVLCGQQVWHITAIMR